MKYIGVKFTTHDKPFEAKGQVYYYKTNLAIEPRAAFIIESNGYTYDNPVIVVSISGKAPDPSRDYKEITKMKPVAYVPRELPEWIKPRHVTFSPDKSKITCIVWENGEKTIVKCGENDIFDFEKGFAMAVITRLYGKSETKKLVKKFITPAEDSYYEKLYGESSMWDDEEE
jgi:hypothetical protein